MTQEEILEYNKFCAEFLGWESAGPGFPVGYWEFNNDKIVLYEHMLFHSDWNWIMEVVEAIEELDIVAYFEIAQPTIYIWKSSESSTFKDIEVDIYTMSKKEAVVQAINQFLIWYKEQTR